MYCEGMLFEDRMVPKTINKRYYEGISESERQRRKESNSLSTKINFWAWIIEVTKQTHIIQNVKRQNYVTMQHFCLIQNMKNHSS